VTKSAPAAKTPRSFLPFEEGIRSAARADRNLPEQEIVLIRLYGHLGKALTAATEKTLAPEHLSLAQWQVLIWLYAHPGEPVNPSQVCTVITESPAGITRITDDLVSRGYVERQPSAADRRRVDLGLTPAGAALVKKLKPVVGRQLQGIFSVLSKTEMRSLETLLKKLLSSVENL
jgi:MarR family transcriptional repressor of emrRAB